MEPRVDAVGVGTPEARTGDRTLGEVLAATLCGAVLGAGVLFAAAEVWVRGGVEGAGRMPLAYALAGIGALCGAAIVLAYVRSDAARAASAGMEAGILVEDYVTGPAPLAPMAWQPVPVLVPLAEAAPAEEARPVASRRVRMRMRRRHQRPPGAVRRVTRPPASLGRMPQQPPAEA